MKRCCLGFALIGMCALSTASRAAVPVSSGLSVSVVVVGACRVTTHGSAQLSPVEVGCSANSPYSVRAGAWQTLDRIQHAAGTSVVKVEY